MDKSWSEKPLKEYWTDVKYTDVAKLDGDHLVQRSLEVGRLGGHWGMYWAAAHCICMYPPTPLAWAAAISQRIAFMALMGATFGATTSVIGKTTGKDRKINYFLGGCAGGALLGVRSHSVAVGAQGCAAMGALTLFRKAADENGWKIWPDEVTEKLTRPEDRIKKT